MHLPLSPLFSKEPKEKQKKGIIYSSALSLSDQTTKPCNKFIPKLITLLVFLQFKIFELRYIKNPWKILC